MTQKNEPTPIEKFLDTQLGLMHPTDLTDLLVDMYELKDTLKGTPFQNFRKKYNTGVDLLAKHRGYKVFNHI